MPKQTARRSRRRSALALTVVAVSLTATAMSGIGVANASSHREAPLTAGDPQHDNTDTYAFVSPDAPDMVTLQANWIPFEEPNGGPNFYPWKAGSHYDINVDSQGTGKPDITYRWIFKDVDVRGTTQHGDKAGGTFLYNDGVVNNLTDPTLLFKQTYDLQEITSTGTKTLVSGVAAPSQTGLASMPNYASLRDQAIVQIPGGGQTVAAQAADPFFLDLRVFDLLYGLNLKETGHNTLAGYNVNFLSIQVPKASLALNGDATKNPVIGVWSTTERQSITLSAGKETPTGDFVQVSRLGNPLVNEVVVPANLKDAFNALTPDQDHTVGAAVQKVLDPELPKLVEKVYGLKAPASPRNDLFEIFLTGIAKGAPTADKSAAPIQADLNSQILNKDVVAANFVPAEELRLNMAVPVTANPNRLGVLAKDFQGFPNGRRLTDDVVDIEILALEGTAQTGVIPPALAGGDGVDKAANAFGTTFPYVALPNTASVNEANGVASTTSTTSTAGTATSPRGGVAAGAGGTALVASTDGLTALPLTGALLGLLVAGGGVLVTVRKRGQRPTGAILS